MEWGIIKTLQEMVGSLKLSFKAELINFPLLITFHSFMGFQIYSFMLLSHFMYTHNLYMCTDANSLIFLCAETQFPELFFSF